MMKLSRETGSASQRYANLFWGLLQTVFMLGLSAAFAHAQQSDEVTELEEVVVEEQGEPESELPLGIGISGRTLTTAPGSGGDAVRTLQSLPGMTFTEDDEPLPAVRGSRPDDNYFQVDFVPAGYLFHAGGLISVFNSELIKSFEIYPSAYGPEFTGFTGGAFDVTLREPKNDAFHYSFDVSILHAGALIEGPVNDSQSFYLAGRFSYLDLFIADQIEDDDEDIVIDQIPKYSDYQGKYVWQLNDGSKLTTQFTGASDIADITLGEEAEGIETDPVLAGRIFEKSNYHEQGLVLDQEFDNGVQLKSALAHRQDASQGKFGGAGELDVETEGWFLKSRAMVPLNDNHDVHVGAELAKLNADIFVEIQLPNCSEFDPDCRLTGADRLTNEDDIKVNSYSAYIKDNWYINDKLTLFPGVALHGDDYYDAQFVEPRLSMEYAASDDLIFSAGTGLYHQAPGYLESTEEFGNPAIGYIESVHGVLGVQKFFGDGWDIKTELYYKKLDNLVTDDDTLQYVNDGEGSAYGMDMLLRKNLTDRFTGWVSASVSEAKRRRKSTGQSFDFEFDQPFNLSLVGSYDLSKRWSIGAKLWMHSGSTYTPVVGAEPDADIPGLYNPVYGEINSKRFPMYHRLDFRVDRTFQQKEGRKMGAYLEILNVLDNNNASGFEYSADYSSSKQTTQLPLIVALGFKASF